LITAKNSRSHPEWGLATGCSNKNKRRSVRSQPRSVSQSQSISTQVDCLTRPMQTDRSAQILQAFNQTQLDSLTAIREIVGETVSFDEIRLVRAWWRGKR